MLNRIALIASFGVLLGAAATAAAQDTIKIGEINSYKAQPAFLDPYKKGWELAVEEVNAAGGVLGKKLQVISRDDLVVALAAGGRLEFAETRLIHHDSPMRAEILPFRADPLPLAQEIPC